MRLEKQLGLGLGPGVVDQENLADHQTRRELQEAFIGYARLAHGWTKADFDQRQIFRAYGPPLFGNASYQGLEIVTEAANLDSNVCSDYALARIQSINV